MEYFKRFRYSFFIFLVISFSFLLLPEFSRALRPIDESDLSENSPSLTAKDTNTKSDTHLQPINENQLDDLSPSLIAPSKKRISSQEFNRIMDQEFAQSICFQRCHKEGDFQAFDNTAKQWRLLIEQEGHSIFSEIPWESPQEKEEVLDYLFKNARNSRPGSAGIGVW